MKKMHWWIIVVGVVSLGIAARWFQQHYWDRAPEFPSIADAFAPSEILFWVDGASEPVSMANAVQGTSGQIAVKVDKPGYAVLFAMNSAGSMFPASKPTEVKPDTVTPIQALSKGQPYRLRVFEKEKAEQVVGGGVNYGVVVTRSPTSAGYYVEWHEKYDSGWHWDEIPHVARVYLVGRPPSP
jgi:hypothetical protein